ncbi:MAG: PPOX class F420-dependent oxidoreductase [Ktedonobacteraceae bacterium]
MITQAQPLIVLKSARYINLITFRKSGAAVATPLWFAEHQGILYTQTFPTAGKLKRIRHTARVKVASCTINGKTLGPEIAGQARIVTSEQEILLAEVALAKKYGLTRSIYFSAMGAFTKLRRQTPSRRTYIAIEPATSVPHSTYSQDLSLPKNVSANHISVVPLFLNW